MMKMNNNGSISLGTSSHVISSSPEGAAQWKTKAKHDPLLQREMLKMMNKKLQHSNDRLRNELEATKAELAQVKRQVRASQTNHQEPTFTKTEIRTMLSKLHPDKNDGKTIYNKITAKLNGLAQ